jgi:predicted dehydrogenase
VSDIGIGLIGLGVHGARYAGHLLRADIPGARLSAVCRRDEGEGRKFAEENGVAFYADYRDLVSSGEVDAVAVVTPSPDHLAMCTAALEAGVDVLVEKPVLHSSSEGPEMDAALSSSGRALMVAQTLRYNGAVRCLRERLSLVGKPVRLRMAFRLPAARLYWESDRGGAPRGSILETGVHLFDAARWILGEEPSRVFCRSDRIFSESAEDFFCAELEFSKSKVHCILEVAKCSPVRIEPIDLSGDKGHLFGNARTNTLTYYGESGSEALDLGPPVHTVGAVLRDFVSSLKEKKPVPITLEDGLYAVRVAEACFESARSGRYVDLPGGVWDGMQKGQM